MSMNEIRAIKNEIETVEAFMKPLIRESEQLDKISAVRRLTKAERARLNELIELVHEKNVFLAKAKDTIAKFFAPKVA